MSMSRARAFVAIHDAAERLVELRVVDRKNRAAPQLPHEAAKPQSKERNGKDDVEPADGHSRSMKLGRGQPEEIDQTDDQDARGDPDDRARLSLHDSGEEQDERHGEVEQDQPDADEPPSRLQPARVPG